MKNISKNDKTNNVSPAQPEQLKELERHICYSGVSLSSVASHELIEQQCESSHNQFPNRLLCFHSKLSDTVLSDT